MREEDALGFLIVGGSRDASPVLNAKSSINLATAIDKAEQKLRARDTGLKFKRFVYGGPFALVGEFATGFGNAKQAIYMELNTGHVVDIEALERVRMTKNPLAPEKWNIVAGLVGRPLSDEVITMVVTQKILSGTFPYDQGYATYSGSACGPTSGAVVLDYFDDKGYNGRTYTNIKGLEYYGSQRSAIDHIYSDMGTSAIGTTTAGYISGIKKHANTEAGYSFTVTSSDLPTWNQYYSSILDNRPVGVFVGAGSGLRYDYHWVTGVGYEVDTNLGTHLMYVETWGGYEWADFDQYTNSPATMAMVFVTPG